MFRYFSIFTSRFSLHSRFLLPTNTRNFSPFAEKLTQESKKSPAAGAADHHIIRGHADEGAYQRATVRREIRRDSRAVEIGAHYLKITSLFTFLRPAAIYFRVFSVVSTGWMSRFTLQSYRYRCVPRRLIFWPAEDGVGHRGDRRGPDFYVRLSVS